MRAKKSTRLITLLLMLVWQLACVPAAQALGAHTDAQISKVDHTALAALTSTSITLSESGPSENGKTAGNQKSSTLSLVFTTYEHWQRPSTISVEVPEEQQTNRLWLLRRRLLI